MGNRDLFKAMYLRASFLLFFICASIIRPLLGAALEIRENYFVRNGKPIYLQVMYDVYVLAIWESDIGFNWRKYLDDLVLHHINYKRIWLAVHHAKSKNYPVQFSNQVRQCKSFGPKIVISRLLCSGS